MRYELSEEWSIIRAMLPAKPRGASRVDDRRVLNGIFWALRSGAPWPDLPPIYAPLAAIVPFVGEGPASGTAYSHHAAVRKIMRTWQAFRKFPRPPVTHGRIPHTLMLPPATTSDSPCNWSQTNHVHSDGIAREEIGCARMGGFTGPHINTTLVILISALYANARLVRALPIPTKRQARERTARSASRRMNGGSFAKDQVSSHLYWRRSTPRRAR